MKRLIIALVVLGGLFVALDFGSAAVAESAVSRQMRSQLGLADDPSVRINGFPFLTQAAAGKYSSVDVDADRVTVGQLRDLDVSAQLRDVTAPLSMLLGSGPKTLQVQTAEGSVSIPADSLEKLLPGVTKLRIETLDENALEQAADDGGDLAVADLDPTKTVRLAGTTALLGQKSDVTVIAELQLAGGQILIVPRDVRVGGVNTIPVAAQRTISRLFTLRLDPGALPLEITPTKLRAANGVLEISGRARDLTLGAATSAAGG